MELKKLKLDFSVCKVKDYLQVNWDTEYLFIGKTDEEHSLVCPTEEVPSNVIQQEDGWRGFRIQGNLDFSLVGILSKISAILADHGISVRIWCPIFLSCNEYYTVFLHSRENATFLELCKNFPNIPIDADRLLPNSLRRVSFALIQAGIDSLRIFCCHLPEAVLYYAWRVISDGQFQEKNLHIPVPAEKI